jgi:hypothetical protein
VLQQQGTPVRVSSAVVGQVWRDGRRQANLARIPAPADLVLTSDPGDIRKLLQARGVTAKVQPV